MDEEDAVQAFQAPLQFNIPEGISSAYATNVLVQRTEHEYILTFFEAKAPIILGPNAPFPDRVQADYLCRVIVAAGRMQGFVEVMRQAIELPRPTRQAEE